MNKNLVLDIGNTRIKLGVFENDKLVFNTIYDSLTINDLKLLVEKHNIGQSIISTVQSIPDGIESYLMSNTKLHHFNNKSEVPFDNSYSTKNTLGKDRVAAMAYASTFYNGEDVLVVDMGTCITYDLLNKQNKYFGGGISPGLNMRLTALNQLTGKLPLVAINEEEKVMLVGSSTENSIKSGVFHGVKHELQGVINEYLSKYSELKIVLTGGNAKMFDLAPKNRIFADNFLVLKGLNEILKCNAKN